MIIRFQCLGVLDTDDLTLYQEDVLDDFQDIRAGLTELDNLINAFRSLQLSYQVTIKSITSQIDIYQNIFYGRYKDTKKEEIDYIKECVIELHRRDCERIQAKGQ